MSLYIPNIRSVARVFVSLCRNKPSIYLTISNMMSRCSNGSCKHAQERIRISVIFPSEFDKILLQNNNEWAILCLVNYQKSSRHKISYQSVSDEQSS